MGVPNWRVATLMRAVLRIPGFRLLLSGVVASMIGDSLMLLVFGIWVKELTGSNGAAGLVMLFVVVPCLIVPLAGAVIDRFRRKRLLVVVNLASTLTVVPLFFVRDTGDVWLIYLCAGLYGLSALIVSATLNGLLKHMVPADLLGDANGAIQTIREGLRLFGPLVGASLFAAFGGWVVAAIDALTFCVAAVAIAMVRVRESEPERARVAWRADLVAGFRHLGTDLILRRIAIAGAAAMAVIGIVESVSFAVVDQGLHRPPEFVGVFSTAQGVGAIVGGITAATLVRRMGVVSATGVGLAAFGIGCGICAFRNEVLVLGGIAIAGAGLAITLVAMTTAIQQRSPHATIGRATLAMETVHGIPQVLSIAAGAALVGIVDYRILLMVILGGLLIVALALQRTPTDSAVAVQDALKREANSR